MNLLLLLLTITVTLVDSFAFLQMSVSEPKHTLYDMPVSNNGARCRIIIYKKGLPENEVKIESPVTLGGLKSPEYLELNPQGKMPLMKINSSKMCVPESDTISRYLLEEYSNISPTFLPNDVKSNLICRLHDMYLTSIQGCMYKAAPPFGAFNNRKDALEEYLRQLQIIENLIEEESLYLCGNEVSLADAALFPSLVFASYMLPKFDFSIPSKLSSYYDILKEKDFVFSKIHEEISGALRSWDDKNRWDSILLAGLRDTSPQTIFDKIINGEIPASIVRDHPKYLAFKDINPAAPAHILVIPKDRATLINLRNASREHEQILGILLLAAAEISKDTSLGFTSEGARIVINDGSVAGQEVPHLHLHVLGGRQMTWPPG